MRRGLSTAELLAALLAAAAFPAPVALAAPFCVETQVVPPQCIYFDAKECRQEATHEGGACVANPQETALTPSVGTYCIVTSGQASACDFQDAGDCAREAVHQGGVCVAAPAAPAVATPNPFQSRPADVNGAPPQP
jgi:hypothetical protein